MPACRRSSRPCKRERRLVRPAGLEPATPGLGNRCSIHLSYGRNQCLCGLSRPRPSTCHTLLPRFSKVERRDGQPEPWRHAADRVSVHHVARWAMHYQSAVAFGSPVCRYISVANERRWSSPGRCRVHRRRRTGSPQALDHTRIAEGAPALEVRELTPRLGPFGRQRECPLMSPLALLPAQTRGHLKNEM